MAISRGEGSSQESSYHNFTHFYLNRVGAHEYKHQHVASLKILCAELEQQQEHLDYVLRMAEGALKNIQLQGACVTAQSVHLS